MRGASWYSAGGVLLQHGVPMAMSDRLRILLMRRTDGGPEAWTPLMGALEEAVDGVEGVEGVVGVEQSLSGMWSTQQQQQQSAKARPSGRHRHRRIRGVAEARAKRRNWATRVSSERAPGGMRSEP